MRLKQKGNRQLSKGDEKHGCRFDDRYLWHVEFCPGCIGLFQGIQDDKKKTDHFSNPGNDLASKCLSPWRREAACMSLSKGRHRDRATTRSSGKLKMSYP